MALIVMKFGGSSLGSIARIQHVAKRVQAQAARGHQLVIVVSAMQGETDRLLKLAASLSDRPSPRERDQLLATGEQASAALVAIALGERGCTAKSLTGAQLRLVTDGQHARARIRRLDREVIATAHAANEVVVVTGFQGIDNHNNVVTLGRGGSDTTAVAIAAALKADVCEILTDVEGVFTADPNLVPRARKIDHLTYDEMMEMASLGAKVLQIRSVELAMNHNVPLHVRSTFSDAEGTWVGSDANSLERVAVRGVSHTRHEAKVTVRKLPDAPGTAATLFMALADASIDVDVIVQNAAFQGVTDVSFTLGQADLDKAQDVLAPLLANWGAGPMEVQADVGKLSIIGVGMMSHPGVAARMFQALSEHDVNISLITTSEIKVTCVIAQESIGVAARALHRAFGLDSQNA